MSKSMMSAAGGGKVTVTGLAANVVKQGTTVTVKQGSKTVASVVGAFAGEVKAMGFFSMTIVGDPRYAKGLYGVVRCSDQSLIADVSHNGTQWGSNTYTVTFRRTAKLRVVGRGPFAIAVGGTALNGSLQTVDVTAGTSIGVTNYTGSNQSPNTISFVEF